MSDILPSLIWVAGLLAGTLILCLTALRAWRGWLDLRREELAADRSEPEPAQSGARIEMADVRERLRKLEAIARGVDL
jgi:cytochrome c-type biogenesis protein CcmH/NrfG